MLQQLRMAGFLCICSLMLVSEAGEVGSASEVDPLVPAMFVFGASMVDGGTTNYIPGFPSAARYPPYGETFFHRPTGRFSNGLIIPDFLAMSLGLPFLPPAMAPAADFSLGANFACAYSGLLNETNREMKTVSFSRQLGQFQELVASWEEGKLSKSIAILNAGTNDVTLHYGSTQDPHPHEFVRLLIGNYEQGLEILYAAGVRRIVVIALAPLGCSPSARAKRAVRSKTGCEESLNEFARMFNAGVEKLMRQLQSSVMKDADLLYFDAYQVFEDMSYNASNYGFTENESSCCGAGPYNCLVYCGRPVPPSLPYRPVLCEDPSKYIYWDIHPTQQAHFTIASAIWSGDQTVIRPTNLLNTVRHLPSPA